MRRTFGLATGFILGLCITNIAVAESDLDDKVLKAREITESIAANYPGLAVSVTVEGKEVWAEGYGFANLETKASADPDTRFNVYSVAKMLTGIAAARLAEMGRLDLDAPLVDVIEELPADYQNVTPRLLIGHLSGIPHYQSDADWEIFSAMHCNTPADALPHFIHRARTSEPGTRRTYTTYGYVLLSEVLARRSSQSSYTRFMQDDVFQIAGMTGTQLDAIDLAPHVKAVPYAGEPGAWQPIEALDASCKFGGGGFLSSARDLARFGAAFYDHVLLSPEGTKKASQPFLLADGESTYYAFGMDTNTFESDGRTVHWARHSGGSPGGRAFIVVLLSERISVGIAANSDGPSLRQAASGIAYIFAGIDP